MTKSIIRKTISKQRNSLTQQYISQESKKIIENIINNLEKIVPNFKNQIIALYLRANKEVETKLLIKYLLKIKSIVLCLPKINKDNNSMEFIEYDNSTKLQQNNKYKSISEPKSDKKVIPQIIFTPLVACDKFGNRIGMGKGFYDRKIQEIKQNNQNATLIGLSYDFQLTDKITTSNNDQTLDFIGLPQYIINITSLKKDKNSKKNI